MRRVVTVAVVAVAQLALVGVAVAPQLSARLLGEDHVMRVAPVDPIDPLRGAYVSLSYPDLHASRGEGDDTWSLDDGESGRVYVSLRRDGDVWVADGWSRERPGGPYLTCDDRSWTVRCGIDSWFLPQQEASEMERMFFAGAYAQVRIDRWGHAALVDVRATP